MVLISECLRIEHRRPFLLPMYMYIFIICHGIPGISSIDCIRNEKIKHMNIDYICYILSRRWYTCVWGIFSTDSVIEWIGKKTKSKFLFKEKKTTMNIHIPNRNDTPDNTPLWCVYYMFYVSSLNRYDFINSHLCNKNAILSVVRHTKRLGRTNEECVIMKVSKQFY